LRISISDKELLAEFEALLGKHKSLLAMMDNDNLKTIIKMCARNGISKVDSMLTAMEEVDKKPAAKEVSQCE
jgi:hypothetical protein